MILSDLKYGQTARIKCIDKEYRGENRRRLLDLGFVRGTVVVVQNISPFGNPVSYCLRDTLIALRKEQSDRIEVELIDKK